MPSDRVYWDSMLFIYRMQENSEWIADLRLFTEAAERDEILIVTSAFTMAEVCKLKELGLLPEEQERLIVDFFENDYIVPYNVDRPVAEKARSIIRNHNLNPADAIHVATALIARANVLLTCDREHLLSKDRQIENLRIELPHWKGQRTLNLPMAPPEK